MFGSLVMKSFAENLSEYIDYVETKIDANEMPEKYEPWLETQPKKEVSPEESLEGSLMLALMGSGKL